MPIPDGRWRRLATRAAWVAVAGINAVLLAVVFAAFFAAPVAFDWDLFVEAGRRYFDGGLYDWAGIASYRYSPLFALLFAVITPIGFLGWSLLHVASLTILPWKLAAIAAVSAPFWYDVQNGNTMTFVVVAAYHALRGNRWGIGAFFVLTLLIPRPLMLPIAAWLLWRHRWILPFVAIVVLHGALVWLTGWGPEWIDNLLSRGTDDLGNRGDFGPSQLLGIWWWPIGLVLAAWLTYRGRLGLASLLASPYWLLHYFQLLLLELPSRDAPPVIVAVARRLAPRRRAPAG